MSTIIDELVVALNLDASKFDEGQKKAVESLRKIEEGADKHVKPATTEIEKMIGAFANLQGRLLAIGSIIAAGLGFNRLVQDATKLNSELGFMANNLGVSAQELSKWEAAGASVGAQANDIAQSFAAIQKSMAEMQLTGQSQLNAFAYTTHQRGQGPAVELYDKNGQWRQPTDILMDISRWAAAQENKAVASQMISKLGMGQGMTNMLMLGPEELKKRLDFANQFAPSDETVRKFQKLTEAFGKLETVTVALERAIAEKLAPTLTRLLDKITEFFGKLAGGENPADVAGGAAASHGFKELAPNAAKPSLAHRAWDWAKSWFGGSSSPAPATEGGGSSIGSGASTGTSAAPGAGEPSVSAPSGAGASVNGSLAEQRSAFRTELQNDPELRDKVLRIAANEQGSHPEGTQGVIESMMNRALVRGTTLAAQARWTSEGGYYQNGNMGVGALENARHRQILERSLENVLGGSNITSYATDNSSQGLAAREKVNGTFNWHVDLGRPGAQESFFSPARAEPMLARRWRAWRDRTEAQEQAVATARAGTQFPAWMSTTDRGNASGQSAAITSFNNWRNLNVGARGAVSRSESTVNNSTNSSQTHIRELNVTVPPGADPSAYGTGIRQELQRFDNVQQANTGLR